MTTLFAMTGIRRDEGLRAWSEDLDVDARVFWVRERADHRLKTEDSDAPVPLPIAAVEPFLSDRHGFWGGAVFAGFHEAPRFRCRSRNSLWPSKLSAPIFRHPTSVQQSLLPFPRP
jgi:hypothetical protein